MDIVFSANNNEEVKILPIIPEELEIDIPRKNDEFETVNNRILNLIGNRELKTLNISSFFPLKKYEFIKKGASKNGWDYVNFFNKWANEKMPIRIVITNNDNVTMLNMACTVENFKYGIDKAGDIKYSLDLKEYTFVKVEKV